MDCKESTQKIGELKNLNSQFDTNFVASKAEKVFEIQSKMKEAIIEFYGPSAELLKGMKEIFKIFDGDGSLRECVVAARNLLDSLPEVDRRKYVEKTYRLWLEEIKATHSKIDISKEFSLFSYYLPFHNSLMLELLFRSENKVVEINQIPRSLMFFFGREYRSGHLKIKKLHNAMEPFMEMKGGLVEIEDLTWDDDAYPKGLMANGLGLRQQGGILKIKNGSGQLAWRSNGTVILDHFCRGDIGEESGHLALFARSVDGSPYQCHGEIIKPSIGKGWCFSSSIFVERFIGEMPELGVVQSEKQVFLTREPENGSELGLPELDGPGEYYIYSEKDDTFKKMGKILGKTSVVGSAKFLPKDDYWGMDKVQKHQLNLAVDTKENPIDYKSFYHGIMILKKAENPNIGRISTGSECGIIIIDDPDLTFEEAKALCVPMDKRKGGIILYLKKWTEKGKYGLSRRRAEFVVI
jgi:hypothetical protein